MSKADNVIQKSNSNISNVPLHKKKWLIDNDPFVGNILNSSAHQNLPLIIVGVHPDDIEVSTTGLQYYLIQKGQTNIRWIILTTGTTGVLDQQIDNYAPMTESELTLRKVELRKIETLAAAKILGIAKKRTKFFNFGAGDTRVEDPASQMGPAQEREFIDYLKKISHRLTQTAALAVAWHFEHDDHTHHVFSARFINSAVARFIQETNHKIFAIRFSLLSGNTNFNQHNGYVLLSKETAEIKDRVLACHKSQAERLRFYGRKTLVEAQREIDEQNLAFLKEQFTEEDFSHYHRAEGFQVYELTPEKISSQAMV